MDQDSTVDSLTAVAVIGMSGRFPGAKNVQEFWANLRNGVESVTELSDEELLAGGVDRETLRNERYVKRVAIVDDIDLFDAHFFGFSPREAQIMDPQHRIFLECSWEALEAAGYDPERYAGRIGVFAGASTNTYLLNLYSQPGLIKSLGSLQTTIASDKDHLTTVVAYKLNLKGPSITVQTACSTSLVAVHLACQSLLNGESDIALAGGVCVSGQKLGYFHNEGDVLSPDGHCRPFDVRANGTVSGNGASVVVLKRLEDALAAGDQVHAIILGSAVNNDGSLKVGYSAPSTKGQAQVIAEAQAVAGVEPETITYIEAHGTATALGDPIEIAALNQAFNGSALKNSCAIGSVKSNIGHLDAAAGVAGLIKTVLALKHGEIPPSLHYEQPNPQIDFSRGPFYVCSRLSKWPRGKHPRRAGVSSFGIGGTNAHAVLQEAPPMEDTRESARDWQLLILSTKTASALEAATARLANHLRDKKENLADVSFTLAVGRRQFEHRRAVVVQRSEDPANAANDIESRQRKVVTTGRVPAHELPVVFMFPGQGAQYAGMGRGLYETEPVFRAAVDECFGLLDYDLRKILYPAQQQVDWATQQIRQTRFTQPALFVTEYALAKLWMAWGVRPAAMIGHSVGEYVAACISGVISLSDALRIVSARGSLIGALPEGVMLSAAVSAQEAESIVRNGSPVSIAAVNGPRSCVFSGPEQGIVALESLLHERGVESRRLHTSHAFHSAMMDPILEPFEDVVKDLKLQQPQIPYISNLTGDWITSEQINPRYWVRHLRERVRLAAGFERLNQLGECLLLEVGPGSTLSVLARQQRPESNGANIYNFTSLPNPHAEEPERMLLLRTLGALWVHGAAVDWEAFFAGEQRRRVELPTYPFERQRYWIEHLPPAKRKSLLRKQNVADWFYLSSWKRTAPLPRVNELAPEVWVIFSDTCGVGGSIAGRLTQLGQRVIIVEAGEEFARNDRNRYRLSADRREDYESLWQSLREEGLKTVRVLHLWSVSQTPETAASDSKEVQAKGYLSLLYLAQTIETEQEPLRLFVVSNQVHAVTGGESLCPAKATIVGLCKVIPQELRNVICQHVDIELKESARLIDDLLAEILSGSPEAGVAYRGGHRWIQTFDPVAPDRPAQPALLREGGVYLITGGLGQIGLLFAEYLARTVRAKLVLLGRSVLLPDNENSQRVKALQEAGAEILIASCDVSDEQRMRSVIENVYEKFGALHGVIHAAAQTGPSSMGEIHETDQLQLEAQLRAKARGLEVLQSILKDRQIDFYLLMSSLSSVAGGLGLAAYSAANSFMDAFAAYQARISDAEWKSVNWDAWNFDDEEPRTGIEPKQGVEAFDRIFSQYGMTQVVVTPSDLETKIDRWIKFSPDAESLPSEPVTTTPVERIERETYAPPRTDLERQIAGVWEELLGREPIGIDDDFFELGGHSLTATRLVARMREIFGVTVPLRTVYQATTVAEWAELISKHSLRSSLVELQPLGDRPPFFCVHARMGGVSSYHPLARHLGTERRFYGLQAKGLDGSEEPYSKLEDIAAHYVRAIRSVQSKGPYAIGGWSFGGLVAFEMAHQLVAQGEAVGLLALLDTYAEPSESFAELDTSQIVSEILAHFNISPDSIGQVDDLDQLWSSLQSEGRVPAGIKSHWFRGYVKVSNANHAARLSYVLRPYPGRITLFQAAEEREESLLEERQRWERLAESVEGHILRCTHNEMVNEPHVSTLAQHLNDSLAKAGL